MSQFDDDDEFLDESEALKSLRSAYNKQKKELVEAKEQLASFSKAQRASSIGEQLKALGVNPKVAALVPESVDPDGVKEWVAEFGDVFGVAKSEPDAKPEAGFYSEEEKAQLGRADAVESAASKPGTPQNIADQIAGAVSEQELLALLRQTPSPTS